MGFRYLRHRDTNHVLSDHLHSMASSGESQGRWQLPTPPIEWPHSNAIDLLLVYGF